MSGPTKGSTGQRKGKAQTPGVGGPNMLEVPYGTGYSVLYGVSTSDILRNFEGIG